MTSRRDPGGAGPRSGLVAVWDHLGDSILTGRRGPSLPLAMTAIWSSIVHSSEFVDVAVETGLVFSERVAAGEGNGVDPTDAENIAGDFPRFSGGVGVIGECNIERAPLPYCP